MPSSNIFLYLTINSKRKPLLFITNKQVVVMMQNTAQKKQETSTYLFMIWMFQVPGQSLSCNDTQIQYQSILAFTHDDGLHSSINWPSLIELKKMKNFPHTHLTDCFMLL
jgi:hypothetical protein